VVRGVTEGVWWRRPALFSGHESQMLLRRAPREPVHQGGLRGPWVERVHGGAGRFFSGHDPCIRSSRGPGVSPPSASNQTLGRGHLSQNRLTANRGPSYSIQRASSDGRWLRPGWWSPHPTAAEALDHRLIGGGSGALLRPDEGGPKTHKPGALWALKESVDGWPIGHHYSQDIRGSTEARNRLRM